MSGHAELGGKFSAKWFLMQEHKVYISIPRRDRAEANHTLDGRQVSVKAGPKARTHAEKLDLGAACVGRSRKQKFRFVR